MDADSGWAKGSKFWTSIWLGWRLKDVDYKEMWKRQGGKCAVCGKEFIDPFVSGKGRGEKATIAGKDGKAIALTCRKHVGEVKK